MGEVTREVLAAIAELGGPLQIDLTPQEVSWSTPLDKDEEHARYDPDQVATYFDAATHAALVLAEFRASFRGRKTPVNAWWGSFDLAVSLFSGQPAEPPSNDFIMRNSMDAQDVAVGWWPGDPNYGKAAFYAYAHPAPDSFSDGNISPAAARWDSKLGLYVLDWDDARAAADPHATALEFARSVFAHACSVCEWDPSWLPASTARRRRLSEARTCSTARPRPRSRARSTRPATRPASLRASGIIESISITSSAPAAKPSMPAWSLAEAASAIA